MKIKKKHLSQSGLSMYTRCAEQYRRRYVCGDIIPPAVAMLTGTGTHKGMEATLTKKIQTGLLAPDEEVAEAARDSVVKAFESGDYMLDEGEKAEGVDKVKAGAIDESVTLATLGNRELAPMVAPKAVERFWAVEIPNFPFDLTGIMDCDEGGTVDDWKTTGKTPTEDSAARLTQLTMYALAKRVLDGIIPRVRIGYMVSTKTPKAMFRDSTRTLEDFTRLMRVMERVCGGIEKEVFPFACAQDPKPWICDPRYCGYYSTCEGVSGKVSVCVNSEMTQNR
jgi:hypothetical protein